MVWVPCVQVEAIQNSRGCPAARLCRVPSTGRKQVWHVPGEQDGIITWSRAMGLHGRPGEAGAGGRDAMCKRPRKPRLTGLDLILKITKRLDS